MILRKRSITLHGHRTSLALEPEFWDGLETIAVLRKVSLAGLIAEIDDDRNHSAPLSSAVRVFVLNHFRDNRYKPPKPHVTSAETL